MADSSQSNSNRNQNRNRGGQSGRRGSDGNRGGGNRNRNRNRNRSQGGGNGGKRFIKQKVPRRTKPPTLWEKFLNAIGLGGKAKAAPKKSATPPPQPAAANSRQDRSPRKKTTRKTAQKKSTRSKNSGGDRGPARKPEKVEVTTPRLYVGNLSYDATGEHLESLFAEFGEVAKAEVVSHQRSQRSKGFAFVEMSSVDEAKRAVDSLHDKEFMGRNLVVSGAKSTGVDNGD